MFIAPIVTVFYLFKVKNKPTFLSLFLITYSISDIINFFDQESYNEYMYFLCNGLYMLSYVFLFLELNKTVNMKEILKKFPIHFAVLTLLNIYIVFVMATIINPITFETDHIEFVRIFEHVYNIILLGLLSMSFFNYLLNENTKPCFCFWMFGFDFFRIFADRLLLSFRRNEHNPYSFHFIGTLCLFNVLFFCHHNV